MPSSDSHSRFQTWLGLRAAGLLTDEEEASLADHLGTCESCREIADPASDPAEGIETWSDHIPSAMLARWSQVQASARGLERELLSRHIAACESCREELELIGHDASLLQEGEAPSKPAQVLTLAPRHRTRAWIQGALVGAALSAAAAMILVPRIPNPDADTLYWVVPGTTRGSAPGVRIPAGTRRVLLAIPSPAQLPPDTQVRLTVTGPGETVHLDRDLAPDLLESSTIMTVLATPDPLEPGIYTVRLSPQNGQEPLTSSFQIRVSDR
jgi:hypothetical protein